MIWDEATKEIDKINEKNQFDTKHDENFYNATKN